ncbi:hypothetical protein Bravens_01937 [Brevibacterium ravenspurgense]|uniref:DUF2029 domain-containing protein n=1 Tax=Brevibacterium ravenspurgense TaxID=479117 RepID=A0A150H5X9_9MICO|nr:hypothetical protein [Brevibacterium ravenspurgense]KXZ57415.1 hypothetical protein Bravens_01937 [Brevibacterium ravenspurgense]
MRSPADIAAPLLGGRGKFLGAPGRGYLRFQAAASLVLLGCVGLAGILRQVPCIAAGWEMPHASYRMCASPIANGLLGAGWPEAPGRTGSALISPAADWFAAGAGAVLSPGESMAILLVLNFAAFLLAGMALLRLLGDRSWFAVFALSPVVFFSIGQSLDPVGLALALWALVLAGEGPAAEVPGGSAGRPLSTLVLVAVMFAVAALISPLAVIVLLGWGIAAVGRGSTQSVLTVAGLFMVTLGALVVVDGRIAGRVHMWLTDGIDRGSLFSLAAYQAEGSALNVAALVVLFAAVAVVAVLLFLRAGAAAGALPITAVLLVAALLTAPRAGVGEALWLVPFAAVAVHSLVLHFLWMLSEAALFIAVNLADADAIDPGKGLVPGWLFVFTTLRWMALAGLLVWVFAAGALKNADGEPAGTTPSGAEVH